MHLLFFVVAIVVVRAARQTRRRNQRSGGKTVSIIVLFVGSRRSMFSTSRIGENASIDSRRRAVGTHVVHLILSIAVVIVVLVLLASFFVHGAALGKFVHVLLSLSFLSLGTKVHSLVRQALVHAIVFVAFSSLLVVLVATIVLVIVVIVLGVSIVVGIVIPVLTTVLTLVLGVLTFVFVRLLLRFLESLNKLSHFHNVLSSVTAASAVAVGTKSKFGDEVASKALLALERGNGNASIKLQGSLSHPRAEHEE